MFGSLVDSVQALSAEGLTDELRAIEAECRRLAARRAAVIVEAERRGTFRDDGHATARGWVRTTVNAPEADVVRWVRTARLTRDLPKVGEALADASVSEAVVGEIARAHTNPRCGGEIADLTDAFLTAGQMLAFPDFQAKVRNWIRLTDTDGAYRDADRANAHRNAWLQQSDGVLHGSIHGGGPAVGEAIEIFERYCQAEFATDCQNIANGGVGRSDPQRRFDAFIAMMRDAAACPASAVGPEPVVNIVCTEGLFEDLLAEAATGERPQRDPGEVFEQRCETVRGIPVDPRTVLAAALIGSVRRVIVSSEGRVIDLGRRSRCFTGAAREAVLLLEQRCCWPGCTVPAGRCEADHTHPWAQLGPTSPWNGGPLCGRHNLLKQRGYRVWRDPHGIWHVYRPDGTEIH